MPNIKYGFGTKYGNTINTMPANTCGPRLIFRPYLKSTKPTPETRKPAMSEPALKSTPQRSAKPAARSHRPTGWPRIRATAPEYRTFTGGSMRLKSVKALLLFGSLVGLGGCVSGSVDGESVAG